MNLSSTLYTGPTPPDLATLPRELTLVRQWVVWRGVEKIDQQTGACKLSKIPVSPKGLRNASTVDARTWGTFEESVHALPVALEEWEEEDPATYRGGGIGFVFAATDAYVGIDLDSCRDPHTGDIAPWAQAHIDALASYTEISQSTTGVHVVTKGTLPQRGNKKGSIEMYAHGRFFVMTGWSLPETPSTITAHQEALFECHGRIFGPQAITRPDGTVVCFCPRCDYLAMLGPDGRCPACGSQPLRTSQGTADPVVASPAAALSDTEVLDQARHGQDGTKFLALWFGDVGKYPSPSEADAALCTLLATYTQDPAQIDALFRRSGLMRDKWDDRRGPQTYGERSIAQALQWQKENANQPTLLVHGIPVSRNGTSPGPEPRDPYACPELPAHARINEALAEKASRFLDEYILFSRKWAPRAYEGFHTAVALFVLATVAARRIKLQFGPHGVYTSLYMALTSRTTLYTKTTAADIGLALLDAAALGYLLADNEASPQAFLRSITRYVPPNYDTMAPEEQAVVQQQLAFTGQRGWFHEEWGQHLEAMMQKNGYMASFRGILKRLDDHKTTSTYTTISRGKETLYKPYVTLLGNVTPADLRPFVKEGSDLWRDGYLARVAFVTPDNTTMSEAEFPDESMTIPDSLTKTLTNWHTRLGIPTATVRPVHDKKGKDTSLYTVHVSPLPEKVYTLHSDVRAAYYRYDKALRQLTRQRKDEDLDGSYGRFPMKALRIAGLLGSLQDDRDSHEIQLAQWSRGQQIAEDWRRDLHRLMHQVQSSPRKPNPQRQLEEKLIAQVHTNGPQTLREFGRTHKTYSRQEIQACVAGLLSAGEFDEHTAGKTLKYTFHVNGTGA